MKNAIKVLCFTLVFIILVTGGGYLYLTLDKGMFEYVDGEQIGTTVITGYIGSEKNVVIPSRLRGKKVIALDTGAFENAEIESVTVGKTVKTIGQNAFKGCTALKTVTLEEGVRSIGESAFMDCSALETVTIPSTIEKINDAAFINSAIKDIDFSKNENFVCENGVIYDADKTQIYCALQSADLSDYECPSTVTTISAYAFYNHKELKSFTINEGVKKIGNATFYGCESLTELRLPSTVVAIDTVIVSLSGVKKIYIPKETVTIDDYAFAEVADGFTIVTPKGSTAEKFAKNNDINVEIYTEA